MALGKTLKQARMRKKLTASEVAAGTRMKTQTVTELEEEDFSSIAAPIYAKGFIRLYAEFVGVDSQPLIAEYVEYFVEGKVPAPPAEEMQPALSPELAAPPKPEPASVPAPVPAPMPIEEPATSPSPGPVAAPVVADGEPDLFSEVEPASNGRRGILMDDGYREEAPDLRDRAGQATASAVDALQQAGDRAGKACRSALQACVQFVVNAWKGLVSTVVARRQELTQIDFRNLSARHMMALLGVLVLVLLVISSLSRCVRGSDDHGRADNSEPALPVAAEPTDVYLD